MPVPTIICPMNLRMTSIWKSPSLITALNNLNLTSEEATISRSSMYSGWSKVIKRVFRLREYNINQINLLFIFCDIFFCCSTTKHVYRFKGFGGSSFSCRFFEVTIKCSSAYYGTWSGTSTKLRLFKYSTCPLFL